MRRFYIAGQEVRAGKDWGITDKINARTTLSFNVQDKLELDRIDNGDAVEIYNGADRIFSGVVSDLVKSEPSPRQLIYNITAVDNAALADRRRIAKVYSDQTAGAIAQDIITEKLGAEGVTPGDIATGPVIKKAVFNYVTCAQALDYIKKLTGLVWNIDGDRRLNLFDRATYSSPFDLTDDVQHSNFQQRKSMKEYRNTQYVRGGRSRTSMQDQETPSPSPDGESRNFVLRFPMAERPTIELNLAGAGWTTVLDSDVGINGLDDDKKWYFEFGSQVISQDRNEVALAPGDAIRVSYYGLRNLFVKIDDPGQIADRREAETGASGIYEDLAVEKSINESAQAIQYAQGLLETYGEIKDVVTFNTVKDGLKAGQLLRVTKPLYDLDADMLIESVSIRPDGPSLVRYTVKALDGAAVGGWEEFFKRLVQNQRDFTIAENEVIITLQTQTETSGYQGEYSLEVWDFPLPEDDLYPAENLYPGTLTKEVTIND